MAADVWHAAGYRGAGVRVGVIDLGFGGYRALLGGELPATVSTRNFVDGQDPEDVASGTSQGTALAEIIHDVAPAADLSLAKISTLADLADAVDWMIAQGVQVIQCTLPWHGMASGDGSGAVADLVNRAREAGILWVTGAGDQARRHWSGDWQDPVNGQAFPFDPWVRYNMLSLNGSPEIPAWVRIEALLRWSDWTEVQQDCDLYLYRATADTVWHAVASSTDVQAGGYTQRPVEALSYTTTGPPAYYALVVRAVQLNRSVHMDLFVYGAPTLNFVVAAQSLTNTADAARALSVGAVSWRAPHVVSGDSSRGPAKGAGGTGAAGLAQPGISAYSDVHTASAGVLSGTGAAAAHVAGAAALVLSRDPSWGPDQVQALLVGRARQHNVPAGWDAAYGHGSLYLGSPSELPVHMWLPLVRR
ncbi:MAG: S8 family serine peptidase [Anaerolineae bacterium]